LYMFTWCFLFNPSILNANRNSLRTKIILLAVLQCLTQKLLGRRYILNEYFRRLSQRHSLLDFPLNVFLKTPKAIWCCWVIWHKMVRNSTQWPVNIEERQWGWSQETWIKGKFCLMDFVAVSVSAFRSYCS
jgi:hypothetical protein